jgi:hypothetical protein
MNTVKDKIIVVTINPCKVGDKLFIDVDGEGNILNPPQPAIVIKKSNYEAYIKNGGKLDPAFNPSRRYYYEVTTD